MRVAEEGVEPSRTGAAASGTTASANSATRLAQYPGRDLNPLLRLERPATTPRGPPGQQCVGQESNLHSQRRVGYSHVGSPMPSRRVRLARVGIEPTASPGLRRSGLPVAYLADEYPR